MKLFSTRYISLCNLDGALIDCKIVYRNFYFHKSEARSSSARYIHSVHIHPAINIYIYSPHSRLFLVLRLFLISGTGTTASLTSAL